MIKVYCGNMCLSETLLSGQCFRAHQLEDGSFDVVLSDRVINVKQVGKFLYVTSSNSHNLESVVIEYFDLSRNYDLIINNLCKENVDFSDILNCCRHYRVLKQNELEMLVSYIISQNNNVKRISNSIETFCKLYGKKIIFNEKEYFLFPSYDSIIKLKLDDLIPIKIGFRDKYIISMIEFLKNHRQFAIEIKNMNTTDALRYLMEIKGVGLKVASCILLFGFARFDVFPIDTWVMHFVENYYGLKGNIKEISNFLGNKFDNNVGLCIQYMYHYNRNVKSIK